MAGSCQDVHSTISVLGVELRLRTPGTKFRLPHASRFHIVSLALSLWKVVFSPAKISTVNRKKILFRDDEDSIVKIQTALSNSLSGAKKTNCHLIATGHLERGLAPIPFHTQFLSAFSHGATID